MPKLTKRAICYVRKDGPTYPNYRKALLLKTFTYSFTIQIQGGRGHWAVHYTSFMITFYYSLAQQLGDFN